MAKRLSLGDILQPISGSNAAAVFIESPIKDVVAAIFNAPMATINGENSLCVGVLCRLAGDAVICQRKFARSFCKCSGVV